MENNTLTQSETRSDIQLTSQINADYRIVLKKHLFHKRKGEDKIRGWMIRRMWQYEAIIQEAFKMGYADFTNKGQTVLMFSFQGIEYGMLTSIENSPSLLRGTSKYDINIITIDKKDTRHYVEHDMFVKAPNKIYLKNYEIPMTHWNRFVEKLDSLKINNISVPIYINPRTREKIAHYLKRIKHRNDSIFSSIFHKNLDNFHMKGSFWVKAKVDERDYFIRVALEQDQLREKIIVLLDVRDYTEKQEKYILSMKQVISENEVNIFNKQKSCIIDSGLKIVTKKVA